jgi:hypothetical protein
MGRMARGQSAGSDRQRPPRIQAKVDAAKAQGATFIVIDTPPHADSAASRAVEVPIWC